MNLKIKFSILIVVLFALIVASCTTIQDDVEEPVIHNEEDLESSTQDDVEEPVIHNEEDLESSTQDEGAGGESVEDDEDLNEIFEESSFDDEDIEIGELI